MDYKGKYLGWFGMGSIGFPMCYGLYKSGYKLVLPTYRREMDQASGFSTLSPDAATKTALIDDMLTGSCLPADSAAELIEKSDVLIISMPTSAQVEELVLGEEGILAKGKPGSIVIDLTSADPLSTQKLNKMLAEKDIALLDACVSGGIAGAIAHTLTIMVGGNQKIFEEAKPILNVIGNPDRVYFVGPSGAGNTIKCVNNFLSACCYSATTEALMVATQAGIDPKRAVEIINASGGRNDASMNKFPNLVFPGNDFNFALSLMLKDVNLFNQTAKAMQVPAFFGNTTAQIWNVAIAENGGGSDCINVAKMYEKWCNADVVGID